jgi:hypothetical protein
MSPATLTAPPTDHTMWRKLLFRVHPDQGGDGELFIWVRNLQEHIVGDGMEDARSSHDRRQPPHPTTGERVPYEAAFGKAGSFAELTRQAVMMAEHVGGPYASLLRMLADCYEVSEAALSPYRWQHQGASYKQLAYIAHLAGMTKSQRTHWYEICRAIPLSQRHAGHILSWLQERAA